MHCWFEDSQSTGGKTYDTYQKMKAQAGWKNRDRLRNVTMADKELIPLQAADLMAREAFKYFDNYGK
jgi:hypothetical protein